MTPRALLAAGLLALALATPGLARAGDLSPEEQRWVKDLVAALGANSPRVRRGAEDGISKMGVDALPTLAEALPGIRGESVLKGLRRALEGMGRAEVTTALARLSQAAGSRAAAKRYDDLAALLAGVAAGTADGGVPATLALVPARLDDWTLVPFAVERPIEGRLPPDLVPGVFIASPEGGLLKVDTDGDSKTDVVLAPGAARVVEAGPPDHRVAVLVYGKGGTWWCSSTSLLRGGGGSSVVELLDVDLDGRFDGPRDQVRVGDGAFGPAGDAHRLALEDRTVAWRVVVEGGARHLALTPEPAPAGIEAEAAAVIAAVNRRRRGIGLPPVRADADHCDACKSHAIYLQKNEGSAETAGLGAHLEQAGKPGYTPEGAIAGANSVLSGATDADAAVEEFAATMLHGKALWGPGTRGFGAGIAPGRGGATVLWGEDPGLVSNGVPLVVPAPGQRRVPLRGHAEVPEPDQPPGWYGSPRGFPVSAFTTGLNLRDVKVRLFLSDGKTPVPGRLWTDDAPIHPGFHGGAFFMPAAPLEPRQSYVAVVSGKGAQGEASWTWAFRTD